MVTSGSLVDGLEKEEAETVFVCVFEFVFVFVFAFVFKFVFLQFKMVMFDVRLTG